MKRVFIIIMLFLFLFDNKLYAKTHFLSNYWYNEDITQLNKEDVTSITFQNDNSVVEDYNFTWNIDNSGLKGYIVCDTDIVISIPKGDTLKSNNDASSMFSFYKYIENKNYETGDDFVEIKDVKSKNELENDDGEKKYGNISHLEYIENLDLLDTSDTTNFSKMFYNLDHLEFLDVSNINTRKAVDMSYMFANVEKIKYINIGFSDSNDIVNMDSMFLNCKSLTSIDLTQFGFENIEHFDNIFDGCENLTTIDLSSLNKKSYEIFDFEKVFANNKKLKTITVNKQTFDYLTDLIKHNKLQNKNNINITIKK